MIDVEVRVVPPPHHSVHHFARWVARSCRQGRRVLNIGAGANLSGDLALVNARCPYLVGVDPDPTVCDNPWLQERHQMTLEEFAPGHEGWFDVAFAVYVLEHVVDPDAFVRACATVLRPGGSLFALTLNVRQYFGATTWAMSRLGLADAMLERLKGREVMDSYHFPTEYRLNSVRAVRRHCEAAGFSSLRFRCYDDTPRYAWYLPERVRWAADAYTRFAYTVGSPALMGHLTFRAVKAEQPAGHAS